METPRVLPSATSARYFAAGENYQIKGIITQSALVLTPVNSPSRQWPDMNGEHP